MYCLEFVQRRPYAQAFTKHVDFQGMMSEDILLKYLSYESLASF